MFLQRIKKKQLKSNSKRFYSDGNQNVISIDLQNITCIGNNYLIYTFQQITFTSTEKYITNCYSFVTHLICMLFSLKCIRDGAKTLPGLENQLIIINRMNSFEVVYLT